MSYKIELYITLAFTYVEWAFQYHIMQNSVESWRLERKIYGLKKIINIV